MAQDPFEGYCLIVDMDATIVERPSSGASPPLIDSPCYKPILRWLQKGGKVAIVTSAGLRALRQVWIHIPVVYRANKQILLSLNGGAVLFTGDEEGELLQDMSFRHYGMEKGTCMSAGEAHAVTADLQKVYQTCFNMMLKDRSVVSLLSRKYHDPVNKLLDDIESNTITISEATAISKLSGRGSIMYNTNETFLYIAHPLCLKPKRPGVEGYAAYIFETDIVADISAMGMPQLHAPALMDDLKRNYTENRLLDIDYAPNSVKIHRLGMTKATPIDWLIGNTSYDPVGKEQLGCNLYASLSADRCIAIGDNPLGNDKPLTQYTDQGMPFVSVARTIDGLPEHLVPCHVGGLETGTARFISTLMDAWPSSSSQLDMTQLTMHAVAASAENA
eukprot:TRINITY_DN6717_c0_g1_i2.p1 TRINITY_DN6717_c0_g1~~TRINITY_DN6717_c0_g1_i2.p1  ORF type:complete len:389 (+),score=37.79 TRINITY_DN6717_c0_g1_i2:2-1168(+)